jgi:hypothetical protein
MASTVKKIELAPDEVYLQEALKNGRGHLVREMSMKALGKPDTRFQSRSDHLDMDHVHRLDLILQQQGSLSPIIVFTAEVASRPQYRIVDGFHRHEVYRIARRESIPAYLIDSYPKSLDREAMMFAAMANQVTLLARNREDMRKAASMLFSDPECWKWSDGRIASHIGIAPVTAMRYRADFMAANSLGPPKIVVGKDGEKYSYKTVQEAPRRVVKPTKVTSTTDQKPGAQVNQALDPENQPRRTLLEFEDLQFFLTRRLISYNSLDTGYKAPGIRGFRVRDSVVTTADLRNPASLPYAVGCLLMLKHLVDFRVDQLVAICYPADGHKASLAIARELGIVFFTPDEFAERFKPGS